MKKEIMQNLIDLGVFTSKAVSEQEYNQGITDKSNPRYIYRKNINSEGREWFEQIDTNDFSEQDIEMLLKTNQAKNIRTIKNVAIFFAVLTGISLVISIISAVSIASLF